MEDRFEAPRTKLRGISDCQGKGHFLFARCSVQISPYVRREHAMKRIVSLIIVVLVYVFLLADYVNAAGNEAMAFRKNVVIDQQGFGIEAFRLLVPQGWNFSGGVMWDNTQYQPFAQISFRIISPDGEVTLEQHPSHLFFFSEDQNLQYSYMQSGKDVLQPISAVDYLSHVFLARARSQVTNIKVIESQNLPQRAKNAWEAAQNELNLFYQISPPQSQSEMSTDAARIKIEYTDGGKRFIEEISASLSYTTTYMPNMYGGYTQSINWGPTAVTCFRAPAHDMNKKINYYNVITKSFKVNPVWQTKCVTFIATLTRERVQMAQRDIARRMRQIGQTQSETGDMIYESYKKRQAAQDEIMKNYSQALRGVDSYSDPVDNSQVELPSGYDSAWTNGRDVYMSEDPNFNPAAELPTGDWQQMQRQE